MGGGAQHKVKIWTLKDLINLKKGGLKDLNRDTARVQNYLFPSILYKITRKNLLISHLSMLVVLLEVSLLSNTI